MRKRRIYYVPGLISLLLLGPLLYSFLQKEKASRDFRVLEVVMPPRPADLLKDTSIYRFPTYPPAREYLRMELTGDAQTDEIKLNYAQLRIREIEQAADQVHGVNFHFGDSAKYGSFVKVLNILSRENAQRYLMGGKDIWYIGTAKAEVEIQTWVCGTSPYGSYPHVVEDDTADLWLTELAHWPIAILFLTLTVVSIRFISRLRPTV